MLENFAMPELKITGLWVGLMYDYVHCFSRKMWIKLW